MFEGEYLHEDKINGYFFNLKGEKEGKIINGDGEIKEYNYDGKLVFEGEYKNGKRWNGNINEYIRDNLKLEGVYIEGKKEGKEIWYNKKGKIEGIYYFENGEYTDIFEKYYDDGQLKLEGNIQTDEVKEYHRNGKVKFEGKYSFLTNKRLEGKEYNNKGNLEFEGLYNDDKKWNGIFKEYDDNGNLKNEGKYLNDKKVL